MMIASLILVGCEESIIPPPPVEGYNPEIQNPQFAGFTVEMECNSYKGNYSYIGTVCPVNQSKTAISYNSTTGNWTTICCSFDMDKCHYESVGNVNSLCINNTASKPFYIMNENGYTRARCCNEKGKDCYIDYNINPSNISTVCDKQYRKSVV